MALLIMSIALAGLSVAYSNYRARNSARRAAEVFRQDLAVARSFSVRTRDTVRVLFDESAMEYRVVSNSGDSLIHRSFTATSEYQLDVLDLEVTGDSIYFDTRGRITITSGSLGSAIFQAGDGRFQVRFNTLGASRVAAQ